jgi:hypothetical protein
MAEGPGIETYANHTNSVTASPVPQEQAQGERDVMRTRAFIYIGIAAASAGVAYAVVRVMLARVPTDPTTERIQQLIDEANRLLAQLDEKKSDS